MEMRHEDEREWRMADIDRDLEGGEGMFVHKVGLASVDRGDGIETDGGRDVNENPLEDLLTDAEEQKEQFNEARERLQNVRQKLKSLVEELHEEDALNDYETEKIHELITDGKYGEAREAIVGARAKHELAFDDEEKDLFAKHFSESWSEHVEAVEQVRTALLDFSRDLSREDLVAYLYGKHSGLNKGDIRAVFDAFDEVDRTGLDVNQMARLLTAYKHDLRVQPTVDVLEAIEQEAER
ncbi:hypothetical protein E6P09_09675 [Haloferax mediterranei ATCC 33500]|uniref:Uncharacterized protein n=2 Tax=Haloferacaceae TaxID=1644056 RepID=I3R483_HALMT|nr:hypothetical protein HFX_1332 [Haloferax mediterranei ATCC 33500]AHZ21598.1 hypothetical protein BM92_02530 [Haloferax mediterranei ATCC 33500]EMA03693.1 hypothetical protein C439_03850 [Haloferax mediterranei ATCC 33500]QCQ76641.1 hypothetical protein E6P09_09675 [Haloferax mediterranei ATCC 33500]